VVNEDDFQYFSTSHWVAQALSPLATPITAWCGVWCIIQYDVWQGRWSQGIHGWRLWERVTTSGWNLERIRHSVDWCGTDISIYTPVICIAYFLVKAGSSYLKFFLITSEERYPNMLL